jgi:transketolase
MFYHNKLNMNNHKFLEKLARLIRYYIITSTIEAGSGHPTSSLSATDLMTGLLFGGIFKFDPENPDNPNNDRLIFSKGHASPLLYSLWAAAGKVTEEELMTLRKFGSPLEGHPTMSFKYTEAATGSLGQGLSIGLGMALNAKYIDKLPYRTYVLLGDSEMSEGSQWEAIQIAAYYKLNNLIGIIDVNRLGQRGETMYGHNLQAYKKRISSFGWETILIDGHNFIDILRAYKKALKSTEKPVMIIARTIKGKGISMLEDKNGWHGKPPGKHELQNILSQLGDVDKNIKGKISMPENLSPSPYNFNSIKENSFNISDKPVATRKAYGFALVDIFKDYPDMVVLDAEVSNSTFSDIFKEKYPDRFFEMFITEQNMAGVAIGLSRRGKIPFVSTFAAFLTRAFDQIRMSRHSDANIKFCGSHAGVSIGEDGSSQMGLEDISMFRTIPDSVVYYPSDAISTMKIVREAASHKGIVYIRTTRNETPIIYNNDESFPAGSCKILRKNENDFISVIGAGITVHEALKAYDNLISKGISIRVIDLYCIKPIEKKALLEAVKGTKAVITVEDHYPEGGIGETVCCMLSDMNMPVHILAVRKLPKSGKSRELLDYEEISYNAIINRVLNIYNSSQTSI